MRKILKQEKKLVAEIKRTAKTGNEVGYSYILEISEARTLRKDCRTRT